MWGRKKEKSAAPAAPSATATATATSSTMANGAAGGGEQAAAASSAQAAQAEPLSTFMFGGDVVEGVTPLIGNCTGDNPEAIQACEWTPGVLNRPKGSGGKEEKKQRFAIFF
ncbi:hypothetical protein ACK3TF_001282 [Chlorella vulgaris]